jgi:hypothetical protein
MIPIKRIKYINDRLFPHHLFLPSQRKITETPKVKIKVRGERKEEGTIYKNCFSGRLSFNSPI